MTGDLEGRPTRPSRLLAGAALGALSWPADLVGALGATWSAARTAPGGAATPGGLPGALVGWHRRRAARFLGWADDGFPARPDRAAVFLWCRVGVGLTGTAVLALLAYGLFAGVAGLLSVLLDVRISVADPAADGQLTPSALLVLAPVGLVLLYLNLMGLVGIGLLDRAAATRWLSADRRDQLERQVRDLTVSRAELLAALDSERARIERDLHDGVQQRAVALGLLVGRARRAVPADGPARDLLGQAMAEAERLVGDLRDVAWRVRPTTLDTLGLHPVLHQLAEHTDPPTTLDWPDPERLPAPVETTLYYVAAEALTNVSRHARATSARVRVAVGQPAGSVTLTVHDDGVGGADAVVGHGLAGLASRVETAGGTLAVDSPVGGPTTLMAVLPCA